jgi:U3 small nucleolar ribonucleoprotein protein IMP4
MLITTSRKPSQRTRSFSRSLERVLKSKYINRGKMSIRDVLIQSSEFGFNNTAVISEMKGNPSRIEIYGPEGESLLALDITVSLSPSKGRIKKDKLRIRCERENLGDKIGTILKIPPENRRPKTENRRPKTENRRPKTENGRPEKKENSNSNLLWIKEGQKGSKSVIEFYDEQGIETGPKVYVHQCRM